MCATVLRSGAEPAHHRLYRASERGFDWMRGVYERSLRHALGHPALMLAVTVVTLAAILSFIPGGLGVSEAGSAQILMKFGQSAATAQAGAILIRSYGMLVVLLGLAHLGVWLVMRSRNSPPAAEQAKND